MPNLNRRLQVFEYVDASPDNNVDSPTYTYARTAWGRIDPIGMAKDTLIAGAARQESDVAILFRDSTPVGAGAVVVDPITGEQWRTAGFESPAVTQAHPIHRASYAAARDERALWGRALMLTVLYDHSDELIERLPEAVDAGLRAMAYVYYDEVKRALAGGYTTGDFVTGRVLNSVTIGEPYDATSGAPDRAIEVGTDVDYAMFWEMGHYNIFTRKFERVEALARIARRHGARDGGRVLGHHALVDAAGSARMTTASSSAIEDTIVSRILDWQPVALIVPPQTGPQTLRTILGGAYIWKVKAKDNPPWPHLVYRIGDRRSDSTTHGTLVNFVVEVDVWNAPRNRARLDATSGIADQIEAGLVDWIMPNEAFRITNVRTRRSDFPYTGDADRDVCREYMQFEGFMWPSYLGREVGAMRGVL